MHGDKLPSGTRNVTLPAIAVGNVPAANDEDVFAGMVRESLTLRWTRRSRDLGDRVSAVAVGADCQPDDQRSHGARPRRRHRRSTPAPTLDGGRGPRTTSETTTFDRRTACRSVEDHGNDADPGDEQCTLTDYARNTSTWLLTRCRGTRTFAVDCTRGPGAGGLTDDDIISDERTSYDELAWNATPTKGNASRSETLKAYNGGNPTYIAENRSVTTTPTVVSSRLGRTAQQDARRVHAGDRRPAHRHDGDQPAGLGEDDGSTNQPGVCPSARPMSTGARSSWPTTVWAG